MNQKTGIRIGIGAFFLLVIFSAGVRAQGPIAQSSAEIYRKLQKLNVLGSVLYIAAHPDDENTRLLAYLAREAQYRTGYLSLTRGDGGQNLIGNEQGVELGLIRTQELLAARRIDGAEQFFSRAYDFGFSKSPEEAMRIWDHEKVLSDVVWTIRNYQPDVIITRFPGDGRAGHGHHSASAILANEAFIAAADPNRFPEQLQAGLHPWKAKRILWNTFNFGGNNTTSEDQFRMEVGAYNSLLGKGYGEIASDSRSQHKSQGFGVAKTRGQATEYFLTTGGDAPRQSLMDGINTNWSRIPGGDAMQPLVDQLLKTYDFEHPEKSLDNLVALYRKIQEHQGMQLYKIAKLREVEELIVACSGIFAEATTDVAFAVQGQPLKVNYVINSRAESQVTLSGIGLDNGWDSTLNQALSTNRNFTLQRTAIIDLAQPVSQPYWLRRAMKPGSFDLEQQSDIATPENSPAFTASFLLQVKGLAITVKRPLQYRFTDPVKGEIYEPVTVVPPLVVSLAPSVILTHVQPGTEKTQHPFLELQYKSNFTGENIPAKISLIQDSAVIYTKDTFFINLEAGKLYENRISLASVFNNKLTPDVHAVITLTLHGRPYEYTQYLRHIAYDHIPDINYFYVDHAKLIAADIKTAGKRIGYITGAGDKVPQALEQMGYEVTILKETDFTNASLSRFDAVIAGVRAYNIYEYLNGKYPALMQYVQNGGNFIVQYNTHAALKARMAPYPLSIVNKRVTDETAAVNFLLPTHPALNYPNKITPTDFDGWIQERSIYHAETTDPHYQMPLGMSDKGEAESKGSLVIAPYGKGNFVYTGIVFFRELPAGVPGAFRLMANLIALPQHKNN